MMMAVRIGKDQGPTLANLFDTTWNAFGDLTQSEIPTSSEEIQKLVADIIEKSEQAVRMVNELGIFSTNEDIKEVVTSEIRFLLLPAVLAYCTDRNIKIDRYDAVQKSQVYCRDFLKLCNQYKVTQVDIPGLKEEEDEEEQGKVEPKVASQRPDMAQLTRQREQKLARFREQKETERKLHELQKSVTREHVDEEEKREYYLMLLQKWIGTCIEQLESIQMELPILEHMKQGGGQETGSISAAANVDTSRKKQSQLPFQRPFIVTKDKLQKAVFGAGYPSVPVMSIDEFYESSVAAGDLPPPPSSQPSVSGAGVTRIEGGDASGETGETEEERERKERKEEQDDEKALQKARNWDDWKDDHRRGWGNTDNKG